MSHAFSVQAFPRMYLLCGAALVVLFAVQVDAREPEPPDPIRPQMLEADEAMRRFAEGGGLIPAYDRDAERWLRRAREAAERSDWKLAIDTLERVIREHGTSIVATGDQSSFRLAVDLAVDQIAAFPPEGLRAYRILCDPIANRLLERGLAEHELNALREIADVYPVSSAGAQALDLLTVWLLDERRPLEALDYLNKLSAYHSAHLSSEEIGLRRALGFAMIGREQAATAALDILEEKHARANGFIERLTRLRGFLSTTQAARSGEMRYSLTWPTRMGPTLNGCARIPTPTFESAATDFFEYPLTERPKRSTVSKIIKRRGRPPVWRAVSDGELLFVTCPTGLYALDMSTLKMAWRAFQKADDVPEARVRHRLRVGGLYGDHQEIDRLDEFTTTALFREYKGALSTGLGLTFVIQQSPLVGELLPTERGQPDRSQPFGAAESAWANALVAYEADNGRIKWILGPGGRNVDSKLADARFYCTPIAVEDELLVTYVRQSGDLYLGALDREGNLIREVILGSGSRQAFPFYGLIEPTVASGRVYVPTAAGMLVAVRLRDFSPLWLASYDREDPQRANRSARRVWLQQSSWAPQNEWMTSPPLMAQGRVILAANDSDDLLCFNAQDGTQVWSRPRDTHRYLIGCDNERVYIGGKTVEAVSLEDGKSIWLYECTTEQQPAGRPVLTEDAVLVATMSGIVRLDRQDGTPAEVGSIEPGNLLALPGALYSVGPYAVAKLTDPAQAEQLVRDRLAVHPDDVAANLRLAQLLQRQGELKAAQTQIDATTSLLKEQQDALPSDDIVGRSLMDDQLERVASTHVSILHDLAMDEDDDDVRAGLLQTAIDTARTPSDRIGAGLEMAAHQYVIGDALAAARGCVALLFDADGGALMIDSGWRVNGQIEIGRRLASYWSSLMDDEQTALAAEIRERLNGDGAVDSVAVVDSLAGLPIATELYIAFADAAEEASDIDGMHYFLQRAIAGAEDASQGEQLVVRLATSYLNPTGSLLPQVSSAVDLLRDAELAVWDQLADSSDIRARYGLADSNGRALRTALMEARPSILSGRGEIDFTLVAEQAVPEELAITTSRSTMPITSFWDRGLAGNPRQQVVPIVMCEQIRGVSAEASGLQRNTWENDLPMIALEDQNPEPDGYRGLRDMAVTNGVAALHSGHRVDAVGVASGKLLWPPIPCNFRDDRRPQPSILGSDGIVIVALDSETVIGVPAREGARPFWRRSWSRRRIDRMYLTATGDLMLIDGSHFGVQVIDPATGLLKREYAYATPEVREDIWNEELERPPVTDRMLAISDGMMAFANKRELIVRRVETGEVAWRHETKNEILQVFGTERGRFVVFSKATQVDVLRCDNGTVESEFDALGVDLPPFDVVIDRPVGSTVERLMMFAQTDDPMDSAEYVLESYPLQGRPISFRRELGRVREVEIMINPRMLRMSPDFVPVISNRRPRENIEFNNRVVRQVSVDVPPQLTIVSKSSEARIGYPYEFKEGRLGGMVDGGVIDQARHKSRRIVDVLVLDQRIVALAPEGYFVLGLRDEAAKDVEGQP